MKDEDFLKLAVQRYDACVEAESRNRRLWKEDLRFAYGEQWPEAAKNLREKENRPCLTINKIPAFTRQVVNDIRQVRPAIKTRPVDSQGDPQTAEIINGMVKAIEQSSSAESAYDWGVQYAVDMGVGYFRIDTEYESEESFDQRIKIGRIQNPFAVYLDPNAVEQDKSDMRYAFIVDHLPRKEFEKTYPNAKSEWAGEESENHKERWFSESKVRVAEYWVKESTRVELHQMTDGNIVKGDIDDDLKPFVVRSRKADEVKITQYLITGQEILEQTEWLGDYIPIVLVAGEEVNIEGEIVYRGMVRDLKDSQRSYNYGRSAAAEDVALRSKSKVMGPRGAFKDPKWRNMNTHNYPYLEYEGNQPPLPVPQNSPDPKLLQEMLSATEEMKQITGIYDPSLGDRSNEVSGTAINARKVQSQIANFHFVDNLGKAMKYAGRILVDLIPKVYDSERVVQILKPDGTEKAVKINAPGIDPETQKEYLYDLQAGRYDVVVDIGPSYATQRQEAVDTMLELLKVHPMAVEVMGDLIAKNMDWPESDELAKRLKLLLPVDIAAEENPKVKAVVMQNQQIIEQGKQYISMLEAQINDLALKLRDKTREIGVKERAQELDEIQAGYEMATDRTEQELKYGVNVPGSVV